MQTPTNHEADFYRAISAQIRELWGDRSASESLVAARAVIPIDSDVLASLENSALIQIVSATCEMPSDWYTVLQTAKAKWVPPDSNSPLDPSPAKSSASAYPIDLPRLSSR